MSVGVPVAVPLSRQLHQDLVQRLDGAEGPTVLAGDFIQLIETPPGLGDRVRPSVWFVLSDGVAPDRATGEVARGTGFKSDLQLGPELFIPGARLEDDPGHG